MATLENLQAKIARLQAQAEALAAKQSAHVVAKIRDIMEKHGLTVADIAAHTGGKTRGRKVAVKKSPAKKAVAKKVVANKTTKNPAAAPSEEAVSTEAS